MNSVVMSNLHGLTLFVWIVSILTSSISDELKTDGTVDLMSNESFNNASPENNHQVLSSDKPVFEYNNSAQILRRHNVTPSLGNEGGPISVDYNTQFASPTTLYSTSISDNQNPRNNFTTDKDGVVKVLEKNIVSKIVPRKGANEMLYTEKENVSTEKSTIQNMNPTFKSSTATVNYTNNEHADKNLNHSKSIASDKGKNVLDITANNTLQQNVNTTLPKQHKAKPTETKAGPNNDTRPLISLTRQRLGLPKRIDYVFQVIIVLIALPALGAIIFRVYKQGRDCWDKRHYRRMDFLIDGMYND